ncbi:hypothetical protein C0Z20_13525 [Trinickia symbiotica]|uniref:Uncharacterized protein n=1 Tax=Trinickia symbiotica TaxID=863227 RepID=A0A2N7X4U1_9BURK|nr:hypothetical protein C0Z20_13525 [Trinickia symbiotica]
MGAIFLRERRPIEAACANQSHSPVSNRCFAATAFRSFSASRGAARVGAAASFRRAPCAHALFRTN